MGTGTDGSHGGVGSTAEVAARPGASAEGPHSTAAAAHALRLAATEAAQLAPREVSRLHLLLGLVHAQQSIAGKVLADGGVTPGPLWCAVEVASGNILARMPTNRPAWFALRPRWTDSARAAVSEAAELAGARRAPAVDTGDLLSAIAASGGRVSRLLDRHGLDHESLAASVKATRADEIEPPDAAWPLPLDRSRIARVYLRRPAAR